VDVPPHDFCKNHDGSSGQMEPDSCLELIVSLCDKFECVVNLLCCDDDSSVRAHCRWSNEVFIANGVEVLYSARRKLQIVVEVKGGGCFLVFLLRL